MSLLIFQRARRIFALSSRAEAVLLQKARAGEREAIQILLSRHRERILNLAFSLLRDRESAEDAAQEIFLRAFQKLPHFRGESEFESWIYRLALNFCLEKRRLQARRDELWALYGEQCEPVENFARRLETRQLLEIALDQLSEPLRVALILREWQGLSYEEIALVLRLPIGTVRSRLHQARRQFQSAWNDLEGES